MKDEVCFFHAKDNKSQFFFLPVVEYARQRVDAASKSVLVKLQLQQHEIGSAQWVRRW